MLAARKVSAQVVELLIAAGSSLDPLKDVKKTALRYAAAGNYADVARLQLDAGADVNILSKSKELCRYLAVRAGCRGAADSIATIIHCR